MNSWIERARQLSDEVLMARDEADPHALISVLVPAQESSALSATPMILSAVDASRTAPSGPSGPSGPSRHSRRARSDHP
ncbi:hypothetical protein OG225_37345 [Nocardia sp. NBC_01377]|uniref:hypothetical protein n=1 Tax=Nocardia sp. NBC_01377 TaxID=2903595 RepID=UPI00324F4C10